MSMTARVADFLQQQQIQYDIIKHAYSISAQGSAIAARIAAEHIAKAVILADHDSKHLMAILPANRQISLHKLQLVMSSTPHLVEERALNQLFSDCEQGAIPAFNQAYNINAIYDDRLIQLSDIYLEAGDHQTLIHLTASQFLLLMSNVKHAQFSEEWIH